MDTNDRQIQISPNFNLVRINEFNEFIWLYYWKEV